jgi:hypothetical protein
MQSQNIFLFFTFVLLVTCCTFEGHTPKSQASLKQSVKQANVYHLTQNSVQ